LFVVKTITHVMCWIKTFNIGTLIEKAIHLSVLQKDPQAGKERKKACPHHLRLSVGVITGRRRWAAAAAP